MELDKVPHNLDQAISMIRDFLSPEDIDFVKSNKSIDVHFSFGRELRNYWSLWDEETPLVKWFRYNLGVDHADDISGIILDCLWRDVNGEPRREKELAASNKEYWERLKDAEETGKSIHLLIDKKDGTVKILPGNEEEK